MSQVPSSKPAVIDFLQFFFFLALLLLLLHREREGHGRRRVPQYSQCSQEGNKSPLSSSIQTFSSFSLTVRFDHNSHFRSPAPRKLIYNSRLVSFSRLDSFPKPNLAESSTLLRPKRIPLNFLSLSLSFICFIILIFKNWSLESVNSLCSEAVDEDEAREARSLLRQFNVIFFFVFFESLLNHAFLVFTLQNFGKKNPFHLI